MNERAMTHDEDVYDEPEEFRPERFLQTVSNERATDDPRNIVFGFGRRCVDSLTLHRSAPK